MSTLLNWLSNQYAELVAAVRFLSILPLPDLMHHTAGKSDTSPPHLISGGAYFSFVGIVFAFLLSLLVILFGCLLPQLALAALLVVAQVLLTGGLHLDGLMDTCDGLFGGRTRERRLEIMHDSRVGSFGVLGGLCTLLLKLAFFASLNTHALIIAMFIVLPSARWVMVLALQIFPPARSTGLGTLYRQAITMQSSVLSGALALLAALIAGHLAGALLWLAATLTAIVLGIWITHLIDGLTGDTYGAIEEMTEVVLLFLLLLLRSWL